MISSVTKLGERMNKKAFVELLESAGEAREHAKGKLELRTTVLPEPSRAMSAHGVKNVRRKLNASQAVFARYLNVSPKLVQAWESKRRQPQGPALLLLRIAEKSPRSFLDAFGQASVRARRLTAAGR